MQIVFLSNSRGGNGRIQFGTAAILCTTLVLAAVAAGLVHVGKHLGAEAEAKKYTARTNAEQPRWQREITAQRTDFTRLNESIELNLNALAVRLGEMQAHVSRLNALGERLASMAKLTDGEFDFSSTPATGGPAPTVPAASEVTDIAAAFTQLSREIEDRTEKLSALESMLLNRDLQAQISLTGTPLKDGWMSSGYGNRVDPLTGRKEFHSGLDFTGESGSKVVALAAGVVSWSGWRDEYGNVVEVNHGNGTVTRYAHNKKNLVKVGDKVDKGQKVAVMGATGRTTGAHVHFEVLRDGKIVNPVDYIRSAKDTSRNSRRQDS